MNGTLCYRVAGASPALANYRELLRSILLLRRGGGMSRRARVHCRDISDGTSYSSYLITNSIFSPKLSICQVHQINRCCLLSRGAGASPARSSLWAGGSIEERGNSELMLQLKCR